MNLCVCVQVGVEPPLGKLFNIEFTKYQVQRKNQNIFELFMVDTPLTWPNNKSSKIRIDHKISINGYFTKNVSISKIFSW